MIAILAITLLLASTQGLDYRVEDGIIKFDVDTNEGSPVGIVMKGNVDPSNELNNRIQTYLKLADTQIPFLESLENKDTRLQWQGEWSFDIGFLKMSFSGSFSAHVGWDVQSTNNGTWESISQVSYVPYFKVWATGQVEGDSLPAKGQYNATLYIADVSTQMLVDFSYQGLCYSMVYHI